MGAPGLEKLPRAASGAASGGPLPLKGASVDQAELQRREEALALEAAERARDLERLETRERLVA